MSDATELLNHVQRLRSILIDVATGRVQIPVAEEEYLAIRGAASRELRSLRVSDPNPFLSLWDWYQHWKANALTSYQSRREYVNDLYRPTIRTLDEMIAGLGKGTSEHNVFSRRLGFSPDSVDPPASVYEDAPAEMRRVLIDIATKSGWNMGELLRVAVGLGKKKWESPEPIQYRPPSRAQVDLIVARWPWYRVYDFAEELARSMLDWTSDHGECPYDVFERALNAYFGQAGIGWQLENGILKARGSEAFRLALHRSASAMGETPLSTAQREIHEAIADLSRRPNPDLTGSIQHAMAALECVARFAADSPNPTLGKLLKQYPGLIPPPLDTAIEKAWGYASNMARHIEEGHEPTRAEAELVVGIATTVATYLARKADRCAH